jgi:hypothetical protein
MATRAVGVAVALAAVLFLVNLVAGPFVSLSTKSWPEEVRGARVIGGVQGPIKRTDPDTTTVRVASGFLGLVSLPLVVTPLTKITVGGKLGGFGDLDRGQLVRVTYDILSDRLIASRIDVLDRSTSEALLPAPTAADAAVGVDASGNESAPSSKSSPVTVGPPAVASPPPTVPRWTSVPSATSMPAPAPEQPKRDPSPSVRKAASAPPAPAAKSAAGSAAPAPAANSNAVSAAPSLRPLAPRPDTRAPSTSAAGEDGTAAVDWLLKQP